MIEQVENDALPLTPAMHKYGYVPLVQRVETAAAFASALDAGYWDVVLAEWELPCFGALEALDMLRKRDLDIPLIVVTGTCAEETAVVAMHAGATDVVVRDRLARLVPAMAREVRDAGIRARLRAAAEQQRRQALILEQVNDAVICIDLEFRIQSWNPAAERTYGWRAEEVTGKLLMEVIPVRRYLDGQSHAAVRKEVFANGSWRGEVIQPHRDGRDIVIDSTVRVLHDDAGTLIGLVGVNRDRTIRHQAETALRASEARLRLLSRRLVEVQEEERRATARELHDRVGQTLAAVVMELQGIARRQDDLSVIRSLALIQAVIGDIRGLMTSLRPSVLDDLGLVSAVRSLADQEAKRSGYQARVAALLGPERLPADIETAAFRIVQEALANVTRHANASNVEITLERDLEGLHLIVADDGRGFDVELVELRALEQGQVGLAALHEHVQRLSGTLRITSTPDEGTSLYVCIPLPQEPDHSSDTSPMRIA